MKMGIKIKGVFLLCLMFSGVLGCASTSGPWVLWMNTKEIHVAKDKSTEIPPEPSKITHDRWIIINAAPKYKQCLKMKKETFEKRKELFSGVIEFMDPFETIRHWVWDPKTGEKSGSITEVLKCLPDTIDPRK